MIIKRLYSFSWKYNDNSLKVIKSFVFFCLLYKQKTFVLHTKVFCIPNITPKSTLSKSCTSFCFWLPLGVVAALLSAPSVQSDNHGSLLKESKHNPHHDGSASMSRSIVEHPVHSNAKAILDNSDGCTNTFKLNGFL